MSSYQAALELQQRIANLIRRDDWIALFMERVSDKSLDPTMSIPVLYQSLLTMTDTENVFYVNEIAAHKITAYAEQLNKHDKSAYFVISDLPTDNGIIIFDVPILARSVDLIHFRSMSWLKLKTQNGTDKDVAFLTFSFSIHAPENIGTLYVSPIIAATFLESGVVEIGAMYEDGTSQSKQAWPYEALPVLDFFICTSRFMRMKIANPVETSPQNKSARRTAQKKYGKVPTVKVLILREIERSELRRLSKATEREYRCRWEVRSHDRHLRDGRIVPIRKYVKGPKDAPLRAYSAIVTNISR